MNIAPLADVKARLSHYIKKSSTGPVIVTKNGRPEAVLLHVTDEDELERIVLAHTPKFMALLDEAYRRIRKKGGIRHKDFWKKVQKKRVT